MAINDYFYDYETNTFNPLVGKIINEKDMNTRYTYLEEYRNYLMLELSKVNKKLSKEHNTEKDYIPHLLGSVIQSLEDYTIRTMYLKTYLMLLEFCKINKISINCEDIPNFGLNIGDSGGVPMEEPVNSLLDLNSSVNYDDKLPEPVKKLDTDLNKDTIKELKATSDLLDKSMNSFKESIYNYDVKYVKENIKSGDPRIEGYNRLVSSIKLLNKNLIKQIREIKTYNTGGKNSGLSKGRLDSKNLYKYRQTPNIFYNNTYKIKESDLAFGICLDVSGSMSGEGIENGKITMILLHETLKSLGINHCICTHTSRAHHQCVINKYQPFKEDKNYTVDKCYSLFDIYARGGNCDSGALYYMQKEFSRVRNKDKICIMFSDGEPTECTGTELKEQIANMEKHGIRVIGIGINFESIKEYYPHNANGKNLKQMLDIVTGILKEYILEKAEK